MQQNTDIQVTFLLGLSDDKAVAVAGYAPDGNLAYSWHGNTSFHPYVDIPVENKKFISIIWFAEPQRQVTRPDIIVNCINDADTSGHSLKVAGEIVAAMTARWPDIAVFNDPARIGATAREAIYNAFHTLPGLTVPRVIRIRPDSVADALGQIARQNLAAPFLIRPCGMHESKNLVLIRGPQDAKLLERFAYDGREFYVTQFIDYAGADGLYRKSRLIMVGGEILPRHHMTGEGWMVHGNLHKTYMAHHAETRIAEENFIRNFRKMISPAALASLQTVYDRIGLDYLGFDFAILPGGDLLIFEINPAQNAFMDVDFDIFPYIKPARDAIVAALNHSITAKIHQARKAA